MPDNGIVEQLHRTLLDGHFRVEGRKTWFETIEEMQLVLDAYLVGYNTKCPHQGRGMNGRTPAKAFRDSIPKANKKEVKPDIKTAADPLARSGNYQVISISVQADASAAGSTSSPARARGRTSSGRSTPARTAVRPS